MPDNSRIEGAVHSAELQHAGKRFALLTIDFPPINAGSQPMRQALLDAINALDPSQVEGVILRGAGNNFVGGADIREFDAEAKEPHLPEIIAALENLPVPVVAAIDGAALGGGYELALGCDARVATPNAMVGLPEVALGLIPGAGGTYRLPRIVGVPLAIDLITSGRRVKGPEAVKLGMVDRVVEGDLEEGAAEFLAGMDGKRLLRHESVPASQEGLIQSAKEAALAKAKGLDAVAAAIDVIEQGAVKPADEVLPQEREVSLRLRRAPQSQALRHLFFAERRAGRIDGNPEIQSISTAGVIGAGQMGRGIAFALARAGIRVKLVETNEAQLSAALTAIGGYAEREAARGKESAAQIAGRIEGASLEALGDCDLVVEAIVEDMAVKHGLLGKLEQVVRKDAILASNTSYLDINEMASVLRDPSRMAGLHFFNPAHVMRLVELVRTDAASPETLATLATLATKLRRLPIIAGVDDGFVANQMFAAYRQQAEFLLQEGAMPREVDETMREFGMPMGPFEVSDLAGLDIAWARRKRQAESRDPDARYVEIPDRLCEMGRFGRKTGRGWYDYRENKKGADDPETQALVIESSRTAGMDRRSFTSEQIVRRLLATVVNKASDILNRGVAQQPGDIDLAWVYGFGFPRLKGGPLHWARQQDGAQILADVQEMVAASGKGFVVSSALESLLSG